MSESAAQFGDRGYLVGVWCAPEHQIDPRAPVFVFLNAGLVHRVGPCRTYADLARRLAKEGFSSLRFDHGGIGDSLNRRDTLSIEEGGAREVVTAMDYVGKEYGSSSFVLIGLCSGARMALNVGANDPRVVGVVSLDGQMFPTWRFWVHRYRFRRRSVLSYLAKRLLASPAGKNAVQVLPEGIKYSMPSKEVVARDLQTLVSRGVQQHWIFTGSFPEKYNHLRQHQDTFRNIDFGDLLRVDYMPDAEHILTTLADQRSVADMVSEWASRLWPAAHKMSRP